MDLSNFIYGVGIVSLSYILLRLSRFIYLFVRPSSLNRYRHDNQSWALVTGASDGIGLGFAQELARNGFNVILHGRNPAKLDQCKARLTQAYPTTQFRLAVLDAGTASNQQIDNLVASFNDLDLTVLINNVGGGAIVQPLEETTSEQVDASINLNARFPTQLTRSLIPSFSKSDSPRLIVNIGSAGDSYVPYAVVYGGSKGFNMAFSSSLSAEMRNTGKNIEVLGISVGKVTDTVTHKEPTSLFIPDSRTMAKAALQRVGCGRGVVVGYFWHAVQMAFLNILPSSVTHAMVGPLMKAMYEETKKSR